MKTNVATSLAVLMYLEKMYKVCAITPPGDSQHDLVGLKLSLMSKSEISLLCKVKAYL